MESATTASKWGSAGRVTLPLSDLGVKNGGVRSNSGPLTASLRSSVLRAASYEPDTAILKLSFVAGAEYKYFLVPERVFNELVSAESAGQYFHDRIRDHFAFQEVR